MAASAAPPGDRLRSEAPRFWAALFQALGLLVVLGAFRATKIVASGLDLGLLGWLSAFLPELAFLLLALGGWYLLGLGLQSALGRGLWWLLFVVWHLGIYGLAVAEQTFFAHSGIRLHATLVGYAASNLEMLQGLLGSGIDAAFWARVGVAAFAFAMAFTVAGVVVRRHPARFPAPLPLAALILCGLVALWMPTHGKVEIAGFGTGLVQELLRPIPDLDDLLGRLPEDAQPQQLYQEPTLLGAARRTPNLVLVILESTGAGAVPIYPGIHPDPHLGARQSAGGVGPPPLPALEALAREGWVYETAYASVTHTSKALVGILCGMYPRLQMPIWESLQDNLPTPCLPRLLSRLGYRTAFLQTAYGAFENRPGLVRNFGFQSSAYQQALERPGFETTGYLGMDEMAMVDPALRWVAEGGPEPFFLTLLTVTPHHPYEVPGAASDTTDLEANYRRALQHQDAFLAKVIEGLQRSGQGDDTLLIVLGDHGEAFGEHLGMQHDVVPYEEVVRVPLVLHGPALLGEPRRIEGLRHHLDLLPTLLDLLDVRWQGRLAGKSLLGPGHARVASSCWYDNTCLAYRRGDRKVVYHYGLRPTEVFDLAADPGEHRNLAPELGRDQILALENEVLAYRGSIEAFWNRHPPRPGPDLWWAGSGGP